MKSRDLTFLSLKNVHVRASGSSRLAGCPAPLAVNAASTTASIVIRRRGFELFIGIHCREWVAISVPASEMRLRL